MGDSQKLFLRPSDIFFSQETIPNRFEDGRLIGDKLDDLVKENMKIEEIRIIRVKNIHGRWFTLDNRRLWVFRNFQKIRLQSYSGTVIPVLVWDRFESQEQLIFAATNTGEDIKIDNDQDPGGNCWKTVDSINTKTYTRPELLLLKHVGGFTWNTTKVITSLIWNGISGIYRHLVMKQELQDSTDLEEVETVG